jgi:hypothetical protein
MTPSSTSRPGRLVALARREHLLDLGAAENVLDPQRAEHAGHLLGDLLGQLVDHVVVLHLDLVPLDQLARLGVRAGR